MTTAEKITRVRELDGKATKAPWELSYYDFQTTALWGPGSKRLGFLVADIAAEHSEDSRLIAEYRTLAPALATELDTALKRVGELEKTEHKIRVIVQAGDLPLANEVWERIKNMFALQREVFALTKQRDTALAKLAAARVALETELRFADFDGRQRIRAALTAIDQPETK